MNPTKYLSGDPKFVSHKQGRYATLGSGYMQHRSGDKVDLHALLTNHSPSVSLVPIHSNLMRVSGLHHGAIAVVDTSLKYRQGKIVVVRFNGDVIIRKLDKKNGRWCFIADDPREPILFVDEYSSIEKLGVVTHAINYMP